MRRPFFLPLFTQVPRRGVLGSSYPRSCIRPLLAGLTPYSPKCLEWKFSEVGLPLYGVLGSCATLPSQVGYSNACYVGRGSSSPLRPTRGGSEREVRDVAEETPPRYCSSCRHELKPEDYLFCPNCGTPFMHPPPPPPQPGAGAPGEPAQEQPAQEEPAAQRGWWRRHPLLSGGLGIIVVLFVFISVVGSLGGGGGGEESAKGGADQENKNSTRSFAGSASTHGLIAFRRYLDLDLTQSAIFTMYPNGTHIRQITHPPEGWSDGSPAWSPDGTKVAFHRQATDEST